MAEDRPISPLQSSNGSVDDDMGAQATMNWEDYNNATYPDHPDDNELMPEFRDDQSMHDLDLSGNVEEGAAEEGILQDEPDVLEISSDSDSDEDHLPHPQTRSNGHRNAPSRSSGFKDGDVVNISDGDSVIDLSNDDPEPPASNSVIDLSNDDPEPSVANNVAGPAVRHGKGKSPNMPAENGAYTTHVVMSSDRSAVSVIIPGDLLPPGDLRLTVSLKGLMDSVPSASSGDSASHTMQDGPCSTPRNLVEPTASAAIPESKMQDGLLSSALLESHGRTVTTVVTTPAASGDPRTYKRSFENHTENCGNASEAGPSAPRVVQDSNQPPFWVVVAGMQPGIYLDPSPEFRFEISNRRNVVFETFHEYKAASDHFEDYLSSCRF